MEFTIKTTINASAQEIYSAWLSSNGHSKMTGGKAIASNQIGDTFSAWDGYISGKNLLLEVNKRIIQSWRTSEFEENEADSQIEIRLSETGGKTQITLIHSNLSDSGEHYKKGWGVHYFQPMKLFFS